MSRLLKCNRCGNEEETPMPVPNLLGIAAPVKAEGWAIMTLGPGPIPARYDLCEDCTEVLVEQFMVGANVHAITQPPGKVELPHDNTLFQDCLLAYDPERGGLICEHDDPERYNKLRVDRAQNVAEGVPEETLDGERLVSCPTLQGGCGGRLPAHALAEHMSTVHGISMQPLQERAAELMSDVATAGYAHSYPQRCTAACSEAHTYDDGCLLKTSMDNPKVYCPEGCNEPETRQSLPGHMYQVHGMTPGTGRYEGQWRLISTQGEDLTEAYSEQDPVREGE